MLEVEKYSYPDAWEKTINLGERPHKKRRHNPFFPRRAEIQWIPIEPPLVKKLEHGSWYHLNESRLELLSAWKDIRILHLSDLHFPMFKGKLNKALQQISSLKPEAIFLTGDLVSNKRGMRQLEHFLSSLPKDSIVIGCPGNWDYKGDKHLQNVSKIIREANVYWMMNQRILLKNGDSKIEIIAMDDIDLGNCDYEWYRKILKDPWTDVRILLVHNPDFAHENDTASIDCILTGHTHGGQIALPRHGAIITSSAYGKLYEAGWYQKNKSRLYINRGLGETTIPLRLFAPAEMMILRLG